MSKILIVDDQPRNLQLLGNILGPKEYDIAMAQNGEDAIRLAYDIMPDLILLDVMMPGIDGFQVARTLSNNTKTKDIPIIFVTAKTDEEDIKEAFASGGIDYITKPVKESEVLARVKTHLELKLHRDNLESLVAEQTAHIRKKNEEIHKKNIELSAANQAKTHFLNNIQHELRTPMNGIIGFNNLMLEEDLDDTLKEYVDIVNTAANALLTIIGDILHFTEMEHDAFKLISAQFNPKSIVQDIHNLFAIRAKEKQIGLRYTVDETVPESLQGDPGRLRQILFNIVGNAVKFTEQGEVSMTMDCDLSGEKPVLQFEVRDTGIGIFEEKRDKLFKPFSQVDDSITRVHGGLGLGLVNAKRMIEMMDGDISYESTPGEGTSFKFFVTLSS